MDRGLFKFFNNQYRWALTNQYRMDAVLSHSIDLLGQPPPFSGWVMERRGAAKRLRSHRKIPITALCQHFTIHLAKLIFTS